MLRASRFADVASAAYTPRAGPSTAAVAVVGLAAVVVAAVSHPAAVEAGPTVCPLRALTGLPCPGCGLTRSWVWLLHGEPGQAMAANPFGVVALLLAVVVIVGSAIALARRRPLPPLGRFFPARVWVPITVAWVAFGLGRVVWVALGQPS